MVSGVKVVVRTLTIYAAETKLRSLYIFITFYFTDLTLIETLKN